MGWRAKCYNTVSCYSIIKDQLNAIAKVFMAATGLTIQGSFMYLNTPYTS